jgi:hypothetical protein
MNENTKQTEQLIKTQHPNQHSTFVFQIPDTIRQVNQAQVVPLSFRLRETLLKGTLALVHGVMKTKTPNQPGS